MNREFFTWMKKEEKKTTRNRQKMAEGNLWEIEPVLLATRLFGACRLVAPSCDTAICPNVAVWQLLQQQQQNTFYEWNIFYLQLLLSVHTRFC